MELPVVLGAAGIAIAAIVAVVVLLIVRELRSRGPRPGGTRPGAAPAGRLDPRAEIALTHHARERMAQRGVGQRELERVVRMPERTAVDERQGSIRLERDVGENALRVWVLPPWPSDRVVVKTTAWSYRRTTTIPRRDIGRVVGRGGERIRAIQASSAARISVQPDGVVRISGDSQAAVDRALALVRAEVAGR